MPDFLRTVGNGLYLDGLLEVLCPLGGVDGDGGAGEIDFDFQVFKVRGLPVVS